MDTKTFIETSIDLINGHFYDKPTKLEIVWQCHLLGNKKAIFIDLDPSNNFLYEVTYNGAKDEFYLDKYDKAENIRVSQSEAK